TGLIEGYVKYSNIFDEPLSLQAGRFQMAYGNGRFIHTSPWNYHERTFDGARASYNPDNFSIDLFYTTHTNSHEYKLNARPGDYPYPAEDYDGYEIFGLWGKSMISDKSELNLFAFRESNSEVGESGEALIDQTTFGTSYYGRYGKLSTDLDFGYQIGTRDDMDVAAYLASFKLAYQFEPVKVHAGTDWHSGTAPDDLLEENNTFDNYIAAKHRFFGNMDYFTAARGLYNGLGVNDYYAGLTFGGKKTDWMFMANFHYFMSNQESASGESAYGQEIDLVLRYNVTRGVFVEWGGGVFFQGELMKKFYELPGDTVREDLGFMSYLRTVFNI
ncbi:MAG: alginate export family protein, partial [Bacteroidota bacterium]